MNVFVKSMGVYRQHSTDKETYAKLILNKNAVGHCTSG